MHFTVDRALLRLVNQVFELERKVARISDGESIQRQVRRMKELFEEDFHLFYQDPTGEVFSETRTDVDGRISGAATDDLVIIETLKPIVRLTNGPTSTIVQKGIVVAGQKKEPFTAPPPPSPL